MSHEHGAKIIDLICCSTFIDRTFFVSAHTRGMRRHGDCGLCGGEMTPCPEGELDRSGPGALVTPCREGVYFVVALFSADAQPITYGEGERITSTGC